MSHFIANFTVVKLRCLNLKVINCTFKIPQSETISDGHFLRLMNLCIALMKLSESNDSANWTCTAQTNIKTKMQLHLFTLDLFCLTYIGPKKSTPDLKNGGLPCSTLNEGTVLMKGLFGLAFLSLHTTHPLPIYLTDTLPLITQNLYVIANSTYSVSKWDISWYSQISSCTTWCLPGGINWCSAELWMSAFDNLPPILIIPHSSGNDVNLRSLLFLFQILHTESIWKVIFWPPQFLELSKSFTSYLRFFHSNKIISSNIWLWWFFDSWKTYHISNKAAC